MKSHDLAKEIAEILDQKKAEKIEILNMTTLTSITDYYVIASVSNTTHVHALCDEIDEQVKKKFGIIPSRVEGYQSALWILMDYGDVMVHIFTDETREFYNLERLWADAPKGEKKSREAEQK